MLHYDTLHCLFLLSVPLQKANGAVQSPRFLLVVLSRFFMQPDVLSVVYLIVLNSIARTPVMAASSRPRGRVLVPVWYSNCKSASRRRMRPPGATPAKPIHQYRFA
jgi:hypothetical protein